MFDRRRLTVLTALVATALMHAGCSTSASRGSPAQVGASPTPQPLPPDGVPSADPVPPATGRVIGLPETVEEANAVLAGVRAGWPLKPDDPLLVPQSLDDVRIVLDKDQLTLFDGARTYLQNSDEAAAPILLAELELAWGESQMLLMELLLRVGGTLAERRAVLRADVAQGRQPAELASLGELLPQILRLTEALRILSIEHLAAGGTLADRLIADHGEDANGYRLAGDYYRIIREWDRYEPIRARLEELSPDSLDGLFLDAATAMQRDGDRARAAALYRQLLDRDSNRVRAQAHLLLIQDSLEGLTRELEMLALLNPQHQLTHWVGGFIIEAWRRAQGPMA